MLGYMRRKEKRGKIKNSMLGNTQLFRTTKELQKEHCVNSSTNQHWSAISWKALQ